MGFGAVYASVNLRFCISVVENKIIHTIFIIVYYPPMCSFIHSIRHLSLWNSQQFAPYFTQLHVGFFMNLPFTWCHIYDYRPPAWPCRSVSSQLQWYFAVIGRLIMQYMHRGVPVDCRGGELVPLAANNGVCWGHTTRAVKPYYCYTFPFTVDEGPPPPISDLPVWSWVLHKRSLSLTHSRSSLALD